MSLKFERVEKARIIGSPLARALHGMTKVVIRGASRLRVYAALGPAPARGAALGRSAARLLSDGLAGGLRGALMSAVMRALVGGLLGGLLLMGGCSTLRLGYGQGANLATWWLDRYADFTEEQRPRVRAALQDWLSWHRSKALADDIALLEQAAREVRQDTTPAQVCAWWNRTVQRRSLYLTQLLPAAAELAATLDERQLRHIEAYQQVKDQDWRDDHLQPKASERFDGEVKRVRERAEMLYGKLDAAQRRTIVDRMQGNTPWDAQRWHAGMLREQAALLQALRGVAGTTPGTTPGITPGTPAAAQARKQLGDALLRPDAGADAATRQWREQLLAYQCDVAAELHNRTTPEQRDTAAGNLRGWAQDLRSHLQPVSR
jgi:hypothetical protein